LKLLENFIYLILVHTYSLIGVRNLHYICLIFAFVVIMTNQYWVVLEMTMRVAVFVIGVLGA